MELATTAKSIEESLKLEEAKRRKREALVILITTLMVFVIAGGFVTRSFERWFDLQVENSLQGSLEIGQTYYQNSANNALFYARQLSQRISQERLFDAQRLGELKEFVQSKQREYNLGT